MKTKINKRLIQILLCMYGTLLMFFSLTNPRDLSVSYLLFPVVWIFLCLIGTLYLFMNVMSVSSEIFNKKYFLYSLASSSLICLVLLLRSVNQLNSRDILLVSLFVLVASMYAYKFKLPNST